MAGRFMMILAACFATINICAQTEGLMVQGISPDLHVTHTVEPKENWYSVGRLFNISPKEIAPYNGLTMDQPLAIGQQLKIPLTRNNFSQNGNKAKDEVFVPVFHTIQDKEWMYRISTNYNKVPVENLERWNNINKDEAKAGTKLIIGYLKVKKDQSALAASGTPVIKAVAPASTPVAQNSEIKKEPAPVTSDSDKQAPVAEEKKKEESSAVATQEKKKEEKPSVAPEEKKAVVTKPVSQPEPGMAVNGGYFRSIFEQSGKTATGSAGIFKSTSGWQDSKYYALMNNVGVGTIIEVTNPSNSKSVYAKVLGQLPDMKESAGLTIRISDAAASELAAGDAKFPVNIKY